MSRQVSRRAVAGLAGLAAGSAAVAAAPAARAPITTIAMADRLEILELIARYAWAYDCGDAAAFADTFIADGTLSAFGSEAARGREALMAFARERFAERGDQDWQHLTDHHVFEGAGSRCAVYSYYSMLEGTRAEPRSFRVRSFGWYSSDCERTAAGWRFCARGIHRWDAGRLPWASAPAGGSRGRG